jgi:hypothetical protein
MKPMSHEAIMDGGIIFSVPYKRKSGMAMILSSDWKQMKLY